MHCDLTFIIKILLAGFQIFLVFPITVTQDEISQSSKQTLWLYMITIFATNGGMIFLTVSSFNFEKMRNDPYYFLGHLRGILFLSCLTTVTLWAWNKRKHFIKIIQKLNYLQKELKFSSKRLKIMFCIVLFELIYVYALFTLALFVGYYDGLTNSFLRIFTTISVALTLMPILAAEMMFINVVAIITLYFKMVNKKLKALRDKSAGMKLSSIWWVTNFSKKLTLINKKLIFFRRINDQSNRFENLRKIYEELYEVKEMIQKYFSVILLMSISVCFIEIVFFAFLKIVSFQRNYNEFTMKEKLYMTYGPSNTMRMIVIISMSEYLSKTIKKTGSILINLLPSSKYYKEILEVWINFTNFF